MRLEPVVREPEVGQRFRVEVEVACGFAVVAAGAGDGGVIEFAADAVAAGELQLEMLALAVGADPLLVDGAKERGSVGHGYSSEWNSTSM